MKKFLIGCLLFIFLLIPSVYADNTVGGILDIPNVEDGNKVTIYVFRSSSCSHCFETITYLGRNAYKYEDYFDVVTYEIDGNSANRDLAHSLATRYGISEDKFGIPFIVIGNTYKEGFSTKNADSLLQMAFDQYINENYQDVVKEVSNLYSGTESHDLKETCKLEGIKYATKTTQIVDTIVIVSIFVVLIGSCTGLVILSRKK